MRSIKYKKHNQRGGHWDNYKLSNRELFLHDVRAGDLESVITLSQLEDVDPTAKNEGVIWASGHGHLPILKYLATLPNVDPTEDDNQAIRLASWGGHLPVVKFLATLPNVDPTANDNEAIREASMNDYLPVVKFLLTIGYYSPDEQAKYLGLPEEEAKKFVEKEQYKYLLDQKALDICMALQHLSLLEMITVVDASIKYAENIPFHVKWNFLQKCK